MCADGSIKNFYDGNRSSPPTRLASYLEEEKEAIRIQL